MSRRSLAVGLGVGVCALAALGLTIVNRGSSSYVVGTPEQAFQQLTTELTRGLRGTKPCVGPEWEPTKPSAFHRCVAIPGQKDGNLVRLQGAMDAVTGNIQRMKLSSSGWYRAAGMANDVTYRLRNGKKQELLVIYHPPSTDDHERLIFFIENL